MPTIFADGVAVQTELSPPVTFRPRPARRRQEQPEEALPPIEGGQVVSNVILDGITADIGEVVAAVIRGDGPSGVFVGRLAGVTADVIVLALTEPTGPIPAGAFVAIRRQEIVAAARLERSR
ncbi:hypothetical protein [Caldinitratiruptor microaerophilus]|uniref:Uncharacterized protein n=1 Tax=Caldinitratiruptor microaerophilus TaxID=671077 RepID=A0AA35CQ96_9FIRM|nr:hypothetical protein [Caldinitratiruptor microaerophilus]BDG62187.1 hypothetical protein caldi_32770 [Caldinitratiruptor microaerophilus]